MKKLICILVILFAVLKNFETVDEEELNCLLTGLI